MKEKIKKNSEKIIKEIPFVFLLLSNYSEVFKWKCITYVIISENQLRVLERQFPRTPSCIRKSKRMVSTLCAQSFPNGYSLRKTLLCTT